MLSPSTEVLDRERKRLLYTRGGVHHLWLVDPLQQLLEVYRLEGGALAPGGQESEGSLGPLR